MSINYRQIPNFMKQREQGIPGIPFLSLIQFGSVLGVGMLGYMLGFSMFALIPLILVTAIATIIWQGEYVFRRLFTIGVGMFRKGIGQGAIIETGIWEEDEEVELQDHERATIYMDGSVLAGQE